MTNKNIVKTSPQINIEKISVLMKKYCGGNYNRFAREIGIDLYK